MWQSSRLRLADQRGFTMIELLISASIIAVIFSFIFGVFFNVLQGKERAEKTGETYQMVRAILSIMERDIRSAALFKYSAGAVFRGEDREEGGASMDRILLTSFTSGPFMSGIPRSDQLLIEYIPVYDPETGQVFLYRSETWDLQKESFSDEERIELATALYGLNLRYYFDNTWHDAWDSDDRNNRLPQAVEIEVAMLDRGGEKQFFTDVVMIETDQSGLF